MQIEEAEDVRFNFRLSRACAGDKHMFCHDVRPGAGAKGQDMGAGKGDNSLAQAMVIHTLQKLTEVGLNTTWATIAWAVTPWGRSAHGLALGKYYIRSKGGGEDSFGRRIA